jgi:branched-chain amino acid aminotransferase
MLAQARSWGFANALLADAIRNVAEIATANIFLSRQAPFPPPISNGTFLAGIMPAHPIAAL